MNQRRGTGETLKGMVPVNLQSIVCDEIGSLGQVQYGTQRVMCNICEALGYKERYLYRGVQTLLVGHDIYIENKGTLET